MGLDQCKNHKAFSIYPFLGGGEGGSYLMLVRDSYNSGCVYIRVWVQETWNPK